MAEPPTDPDLYLPDPLPERRSETRRPVVLCVCRVLIRPSYQAQTALVVNVSSRGMAVVLARPRCVGEVLALQLPGCPPGTFDVRLAWVQHVQPYGDLGWLHGCQFGWALSDDDLAAIA